jgi:hypothetical protein
MIIGEADSIWLACVVYFAHKNILFTLINCIESNKFGVTSIKILREEY